MKAREILEARWNPDPADQEILRKYVEAVVEILKKANDDWVEKQRKSGY